MRSDASRIRHEGARIAATRFGPRHSLFAVYMPRDDPAVRSVRVDIQTASGTDPAWQLLHLRDIDGQPERSVLLILSETGSAAVRSVAHVIVDLRGDPSVSTVEFVVPASAHVGFRTFLRCHLAGIPQEAREVTLGFFASYFARAAATRGQITLGRLMMSMRNALREPYPPCACGGREAAGLAIDALYRIGADTFWVRGWLVDRDAALRRLTAVTPEGYRVELLPSLHRHARPDVERLYPAFPDAPEPATGFVAHFRTPAASYEPDGWIVEMEDELGEVCEVLTPPVVQDPTSVRSGLLDALRGVSSQLAEACVRPAVSALQERVHQDARVGCVLQFGDPPAAPTVTVIVPLHLRMDFLEPQLAQFRHEPEIARQDLLYVLDSPDQGHTVAQQAAYLHAIHGLSFRLVIMRRNGGYAAASNSGASCAMGPLLLFLNSDVLPGRPGWLGRMTAFYRNAPNVGAVGTKLLYEDGALQHAGLYFERCPVDGLWDRVHRFKGLHGDLPAANTPRRVPAVTGCVMVDRQLFETAGGFRGIYLHGDYEDSDLCVRLALQSRENWYLGNVELHHLETHSSRSEVSEPVDWYNRSLLTSLRNAQIIDIMKTFEPNLTTERAGV